MFNKKGQAALEFLTTYGWAFLVILVMIGALSYFGVLNPEAYIPEACNFGAVLSCSGSYGIEYARATNLGITRIDVMNMMNNEFSIDTVEFKEKSDPAFVDVTALSTWGVHGGLVTAWNLPTQNADQLVITYNEDLVAVADYVVRDNMNAKKIYQFRIVYTLGSSSTIKKVVEGSITTRPYVVT